MITTFGMKSDMYSNQIVAKLDTDALFKGQPISQRNGLFGRIRTFIHQNVPSERY